MKVLALAVAAVALSGCAYPTSSISQGAETSHFRLAGPLGAMISVDGRPRGSVEDVKKPLIVDVDAARHVVEVTVGGRVTLHREYEIGAGSTVEIRVEN